MRAVPGLRRILQFDAGATYPSGSFKLDCIRTVAFAVESLLKILKDDSLGEIFSFISKGIGPISETPQYEEDKDKFALIRYFAVKGLGHCNTDNALGLLTEAMTDPHQRVSEIAKEIAAQKLWKAAGDGQIGVVNLLIEKGVEIAATNSSGQTPLHSASAQGQKEVAVILISKGADMNEVDTKHGMTPLDYAISYNHKKTVKLLVDKGADVNSNKNEWKATPLY
ncbi:ankyrin repeat domain-containing protein, partial [Thermodesulfobacteriota bacterium]